MADRDETLPSGRWQFDAAVTAVFDDMLARSIPQYDVMRATVTALGKRYVQPRTAIVDLGASRGEAIAPFLQEFGGANQYVLCEVSPPMLDALRARFGDWVIGTSTARWPIVDVRNLDLRKNYPKVPASLTLAILTLQFVPIEYRQRIVSDAYKHTIPGGALIVVEKVLGASADLDAAYVETYYASKSANGYTDEQIERKRYALEGVLVPVTARWNEELLRGAGFSKVDCFWRWLNFAGWLAIKDE